MPSNLRPRLVAFFDESGCSGNQYGRGSSEFLVIGAIVYALANESSVLEALQPAQTDDGRTIVFKKFSKNSDATNFLLTQRLASKPVWITQVALHKPSMEGGHLRAIHQDEYQYLCKFAIERVSWMARDSAKGNPSENLVQMVFSEQKMYPYSDLRDYLNKLRKGRYNCSVERFMHTVFRSKPHEDRTGLHLADIVASSLARAIEKKQYGMTDDRFQRNIMRKLYKKEGRQYGLKLFPPREMKELLGQPRFDFARNL